MPENITKPRKKLKRYDTPGHAHELTFSCYHRFDDHADPIAILTDISKAYRQEGGYIPALPFAQRALEISKKVHGQNSLETFSTLDFVGTLYRLQGDNLKALEYYQRALPIVQKNLVTDHPA